MKATINYLFNTSREIISFDNSEFERPQNFRDLKKCDNVIVGDKIDEDSRCKTREVLIDDRIVFVMPNIVNHPCGGLMNVLEIM